MDFFIVANIKSRQHLVYIISISWILHKEAFITTEPDAFRGVPLSGIGPAKAFRCGRMLVRRI